MISTVLPIIALLSLAAAACGIGAYDNHIVVPHGGAASASEPPQLQIKAAPTARLDEKLSIDWRITNAGPSPIFLYSTLLKQTSFTEIDIDQERRRIEVRFLSLKPLPYDVNPNYFPQTEFARLAPGESMDGRFTSNRPIEQLLNYKLVRREPLEEKVVARVTPGTWDVRIAVAYGHEVESVLKNIEKLRSRNVGHPLAPVVEWQKISYSEPIPLIIKVAHNPGNYTFR